jgi:hypothetical protein
MSLNAHAAEATDLAQLRAEVEDLKRSYEERLRQLEARLAQAEAGASAAAAPIPPAPPVAVTSTPAPATSAGSGAFNPAISLILSGGYTHLSQDPTDYRIAGFGTGGEIGPGRRGFSLAETELGIAANVDPFLSGFVNLSVAPDNTIAVEEAYVQTLALGNGVTARAGRFKVALGYLNEQHAHVWDFVDAPLAYQAFLGGQFIDDGVELRWLAPTDMYLEFGAHAGRGLSFPASDRGTNGVGVVSAFARIGGDIGASHSWRAGLSYLTTSPHERTQDDLDPDGHPTSSLFSGDSQLWIADLVWKWAPNGNGTQRNFKFQSELFQRRESGTLLYDIDGLNASGGYRATSRGGYAQAVYQFMPRWRTGLRFERLDSGTPTFDVAGVSLPQFDPNRTSALLEYGPSEFSRFRLQWSREQVRPGTTDQQWFLQYQMSLGAHGAHGF